MTMAPMAREEACYAIQLTAADNFDEWRDAARHLVQCGVPPEKMSWQEPGASADLFGFGKDRLPVPGPDRPDVRVAKDFLQEARLVALHSDPDRFALLYRLLWRLQTAPRLMEDGADCDVRRLHDLCRSVRRDIHKMRAFVRFRKLDAPAGKGEDRYIAWFEPEHHIVRHNALFFVRRFANMHWSILTPKGSAHWDGERLFDGPPAQRSDAPSDDPTEDLWRSYYASIFNPARLKVNAMLSEMPKKYWRNMPEAELIPELIAGARNREVEMVAAGEIHSGDRPTSLDEIAEAIRTCQRCQVCELATNAVKGEGAETARLMIVGEQPGDQEDKVGRPFVGPAGQLLDTHLDRAGIDRAAAYVTNAVKHFKFVPRGKRRIHQTPTAKEIDSCRWWLDGEREIVRPKLVLALGASAARGLLGKTVSVNRVRGRPIALKDGGELWVTVHPSYLLRLDGEARAYQEQLFAHDLALLRVRLDEVTPTLATVSQSVS